MPKNFLLLLLFIIFVTGCVSTRSTTNTDVPGRQLLRVGITTDARPMAYKENGRITGLEAELAGGLAEYGKRNLRFVELPWKEQIPALLAGRIDIIMSAMTVTRARKYQISFADPYLATGQVCLVRLAELNRFSDGFTDLLSPIVRVGTVSATTGDMLIIQNKSNGKIMHYKNADRGVRALLEKEIDAFVYDLPMNFYLGAKYADQGLVSVALPLTREYIAWGMRNDEAELLALANSYLKEIKDSGKLQKMIIHWIPFYETMYNRK